MEIDDRNNNDDSRRIQQRRDAARLEHERKQKTEPMRTFEAKLTEKASHEIAQKESMTKMQREHDQDAKDKQSLLDKILGAAAKDKDEAADKSRVHEMKFQSQKEYERKDETREKELNKNDDAEILKEKKDHVETEKKKTEFAEDGHRRVVEKQGGDDSSGADTGTGQGERDLGGGSAGADTDSGSGAGSGHHSRQQTFAKDLIIRSRLHPAQKGGGSQRGFRQDSRAFTEQNLDEIVSKVETGVDAGGDEFFSVELSDKYFDGLKLQAVRTDKGVVLKFMCPNLSVRSTFIKYRPAIHAHLKAKNISVFRIDIV